MPKKTQITYIKLVENNMINQPGFICIIYMYVCDIACIFFLIIIVTQISIKSRANVHNLSDYYQLSYVMILTLYGIERQKRI